MAPLHTAAAHGSLSVIKLLANRGAKIMAVDNRKNTPLHLAARSGNLKIVKTILEATG